MDFRILNMLIRFNKEFSRKKARPKDLNDTECMICSYVYSNSDCSQDDVAHALNIDKTTIGKAIASLESRNFIQRTKDLVDRRIKRLRITESGHKKIGDLIDVHDEWLRQVLSCLSNEEQKQFESYCVRMLAKAEELAGKHKNHISTKKAIQS